MYTRGLKLDLFLLNKRQEPFRSFFIEELRYSIFYGKMRIILLQRSKVNKQITSPWLCNMCGWEGVDSGFPRDVTAAMLMYRTMAKQVFWEFDSIIMQNLSNILPFFCTPTWLSHHISANQECIFLCPCFTLFSVPTLRWKSQSAQQGNWRQCWSISFEESNNIFVRRNSEVSHVTCNQADVNTTYLGPTTSVLQKFSFVLSLMLVTMFFFLPEMSLINAKVRWTSMWY